MPVNITVKQPMFVRVLSALGNQELEKDVNNWLARALSQAGSIRGISFGTYSTSCSVVIWYSADHPVL